MDEQRRTEECLNVVFNKHETRMKNRRMFQWMDE